MERCTFVNATAPSPSTQVVFTTQPVLFLKWSAPAAAGKVLLQLVKLTGARVGFFCGSRMCVRTRRGSDRGHIRCLCTGASASLVTRRPTQPE